ncbi:MAG: 50S ribosomal protein L20 [Patescibacteria group bacterium]|jgi:large subunit ribosomal protein L20
MRVKRGTSHVKRRRNLLKKAKGFSWGRKSHIKKAKTAVTKAGVHAYRDRRRKKREKRALWQIRLNAAARQEGMTYSQFIHALKIKEIALNRKVLSEIAMDEPAVFAEIVKKVK